LTFVNRIGWAKARPGAEPGASTKTQIVAAIGERRGRTEPELRLANPAPVRLSSFGDQTQGIGRCRTRRAGMSAARPPDMAVAFMLQIGMNGNGLI
jgi:hypothetical protein